MRSWSNSSICFSVVFTFFLAVYAKNSIKKFMTGYFFRSIQTQFFLFFSFTSFKKKINMPPTLLCFKVVGEMFCLAIMNLRLEIYIYHVDDYFILFQFLTLFRFITAIIWYNIPFTKLYFALIVCCQKYFSSIVFHGAWKE